MEIFTWITCTVKRKLEGKHEETTLGTHVFEIQPASGAALDTPFGAIPAGVYALFTEDDDLPKFTLGEGEEAVDYTLQEKDIIYPAGYDSNPPTHFPRMEVTQVFPYETHHYEIIAQGPRLP